MQSNVLSGQVLSSRARYGKVKLGMDQRSPKQETLNL